jgi:hypothetical protein
MVEDSTSDEVMLPPRDFMDAAEAMSWIGYGKALRKHDWCKHLFRLSRDWAFRDGIGIKTEDPPQGLFFADQWFSSTGELLSTFKARASGSMWPPYPGIKTEEGRNLAEQYLARFDIRDAAGWTSLGQQLKPDIQRRDPFLEKLRSAAGKLRRELYKGSLIAWGSKDASDPVNESPRQKILRDEWPPGVEIDFDGCVREKEGWDLGIRWMLLSFDTEEVLAVWPPSLFQPQAPPAHSNPELDRASNDPVFPPSIHVERATEAYEMFIPLGRVSYRLAAIRLATRIANMANCKRPDGPIMDATDFITESLEDLGRSLASGHVKSWGIVTEPWLDMGGYLHDPGEEIELPPSVWRRPNARRRMIEPPRDGWMDGEIVAGDGRVVVLVDELDLDCYIESVCSEAPGETAKAAESQAPSTRDAGKRHTAIAPAEDPAVAIEWMRHYATKFKAAHDRVIKRGDAISTMMKTTGVRWRQAAAAYKALPYPDLRNPPRA